MTDVSLDLSAVTFAKTAIGQPEIQNRSLGLTPLTRWVLVLVTDNVAAGSRRHSYRARTFRRF